MKNKIILVGGCCATGKSTFSRELARRLGVPCFNTDTIQEVVGESFGPENHGVYMNAGEAAFSLAMHIAERFLQAGRICVLESNFNLTQGERIKKMLEEYGCECLTFVFTGDLDVLYGRYESRDEREKRHWIHRTAKDIKDHFKDGNLMMGRFEAGETIRTDATCFEQVDYDSLFAAALRFAGTD